MLGDDIAKKFILFWNNYVTPLKQSVNAGKWMRQGKNENSFTEAEPNNNHRYLAEFAKKGAKIVTANFDVCIEKAINSDSQMRELWKRNHYLRICCLRDPKYLKMV